VVVGIAEAACYYRDRIRAGGSALRRSNVPGPLEGFRAIDLGFWVAGPSTAGLLADWGADVVKIEPLTGDPLRGLFSTVSGSKKWQGSGRNPPFELDNRGKRSVALDVASDEGRAIALALIERADVLVTNLRPQALERLALTYEGVRDANPRLVYCEVSGYGPDTEERNRASFDIGAFWSQAGFAATITPPEGSPPLEPSAFGDHVVAQSAAGAICAALLARGRTGCGQRVVVSLLRTGVYTLGWDTSMALAGARIRAQDRARMPNPLVNCYRAADDWFWLMLLQADRHWPDVCRAIDRDDLRDEPRFANIMVRAQHAAELIAELDAIFAQKTRAEWGAIFDRENVWWAPVQSINQVLDDPIAQAAGVFVGLNGANPEGAVRAVAPPADFSGTPWSLRGPAPEFGQHTEEVLLELGYDWERIAALKERSVIP